MLGLLLLLVTTICHAPIFTQDLAGIHVWRQSQTQLNIINFYRYDFNILHPRHHALNINAGNTILRYEFPLMQWMIALNHKLFGPHIVVTRVSLFLFSIITLLGVFQLLFPQAPAASAATPAPCMQQEHLDPPPSADKGARISGETHTSTRRVTSEVGEIRGSCLLWTSPQ